MKKALSVILALVLAFGCFFCLLAGAEYVEDNHFDEFYPELSALRTEGENYPTIILPGINHSPYYLTDENGEVVKDKDGKEMTSSLLLLNTDSLKKELFKTIPSLLFSVIFQRDLGAAERVGALVKELMKYMETDEDGNTVYNLVTKKFNVPVSEMNESDRHFFYTMLPVEPIAELCGEENLFLYTCPDLKLPPLLPGCHSMYPFFCQIPATGNLHYPN